MATVKRHRTRRSFIWLKLLLIAGILAAGLAWLYREPIAGYSVLGTAYGARVACSCRFVGGRSLKDCEKDFERGMWLISLSEDVKAKSVTASLPLIASQTATFRKGYGCVLQHWDD